MANDSSYTGDFALSMAREQRIGTFVADPGGLCFWVSPDFCEITALSRHDVVGQFWFRIFAERDRKQAIAQWEERAKDSGIFTFTGSLDQKTAKTARITVRVETVAEYTGKSTYCIGFVTENLDTVRGARPSRLDEALKQIDKLERDRFDLTASLNVSDSTLNQLQGDLSRAQLKNQELAKRVDELGTNASRTEAKLAQTCSEKFSLESQIAELKASHGRIVDDQQKQLISVQSNLEATLVQKIDEVKTLREQNEKLNKELETTKQRSAESETAQNASSEQLKKTERELGDRIKSLEAAVEREKSNSRTKIEELEKEHAQSKAELDAQLIKMLNEATDLLNAKKQLTERITALGRSIEKADEREKVLLGRIQSLELSISAEKGIVSGQNEAILKMKSSETELESERKKNGELAQKVTELNEQLARAANELEDSKTAIRGISNKSVELDETRARYEKEVGALTAERETLQSELATLRTQVSLMSQEIALQKSLGAKAANRNAQEAWALSHIAKHFSALFHEAFSLLHHAALNDDSARRVVTLRTSADYLSKTTTVLIDTLQLEQDGESIGHEPINLRRFLGQLAGVHNFRASQHGVDFSFEVPSDAPETVWGDPQRLEHVLSTLLGNVLKLLPEAGAVFLSAEMSKETVEQVDCKFLIRCSQISDVSQRQAICALAASNTALATQNSDALGFLISRRILALMQSNLDVHETPDGLEISFTIPFSLSEKQAVAAPALLSMTPKTTAMVAAQPEPEAAIEIGAEPEAPPAEAAAQTNGHSESTESHRALKVLLAEDNRINQNTITRILKRHHHEVELAVNGKEASEKAQRAEYDLVLMDCQMPQMDGYQATKSIRNFQQTRGVRSTIIGMSAHLDMDGRERCLNAGMDDYVSKPIQEQKLIELLRKLFP